MVSASMKRIIWGLGWFLVATIDQYLSFKRGIDVTQDVLLVSLLIWIIPLFAFKNDGDKE